MDEHMIESGNTCTITKTLRLYEEHGDFIRKVIRFHLGTSPMADDLFQSFFLHFLQNPIHNEIMDKRSYLYRAVTNDIINHINKIKVYKKQISSYSQLKTFKAVTYDFYEKAMVADEFDFIMKIADSCLPAHIAEALRLRYKKDLTNKDIAQTMSVRKETVTRYVCMGLKKLRKIFKNKGTRND